VVLTGDRHATWVCDLKPHDATVASAAQFVVENGRPGVHVVSG